MRSRVVRPGIVGLAIVIVLAAMVLLRPTPSAGQQEIGNFVGVWHRYQPFDNSNVFFAITDDHAVRQFDSSATVGCRSEGGGPWWGEAKKATVEGDTLTARIIGRCKSGQGFAFTQVFTYQASTNTLLSGFGG